MARDAEREARIKQDDTADRMAETSETLARTAEALAETAERSADVHDAMAAYRPDAREHATRDRALAEAERQAAAAFRRGEVPPDDVRQVIRDSRPGPDE